MAVVAPGGVWNTFEVEQGEIVFIPQGFFHYIENIGPGSLTFLLVFNVDVVTSIGLGESIGGIPHSVLAPSLQVPEAEVKNFPEIHQQPSIISKNDTGS